MNSAVTTAPTVLHVVRPYANAEEYVAAEAWTVDARNMLLIDEPPLPEGTPVVFDVTLGDGSRPIKAEARVTGAVEPKDGRPGGLKVRFKRYGAPTKAFIDRAVALSARGAGSAPSASAPEVTASAPEHAAPEAVAPERFDIASIEATPSTVSEDAGLHETVAASALVLEPGVSDSQPAPRPSPSDAPTLFRALPALLGAEPDAAMALETLRRRQVEAPDVPPNRDYLLEKLRQRGQQEDVTMRHGAD